MLIINHHVFEKKKSTHLKWMLFKEMWGKKGLNSLEGQIIGTIVLTADINQLDFCT